jgi:hypothetical protein
MVLIKQKHNTVLVKDGNGILNNILNSKSLPELHSFDISDDGSFKRASFLGPGTKLDKRLKNYNEKDGTYDEILTKPINRLDSAALQHDLAYGKHKDVKNRNKADDDLKKVAAEIFRSPKSSKIQKANALLVYAIMDHKVKTGSGIHPDLLRGLISLLAIGATAAGTYGLSRLKSGSGVNDNSNPLQGLESLLPLIELLL